MNKLSKHVYPIKLDTETVRKIDAGEITSFRKVISPKPGQGPLAKLLWVQEDWYSDEKDLEYAQAKHEDMLGSLEGGPIFYRALEDPEHESMFEWRDASTMPQWACRLWIEVVSVTLERSLETKLWEQVIAFKVVGEDGREKENVD